MSLPQKLARKLLRENRRNGRSWRRIAREDYQNKVAPGTLNRFAKSKGEWLPKDRNILIAMGIKKPRTTRPIIKDLLDETEEAIIAAFENRYAMPEQTPYNKKMVSAFLKACKRRVSVSTIGAKHEKHKPADFHR